MAADKLRRELAQKDVLSEQDLNQQSAILYDYLLQQNKAQIKRLPSMMQNGAPVPGFNNEEFDKLEKESQERWEVILEYHPDVLASVIRRMKEMFHDIYTDPEIKKINAAMMMQPYDRAAAVLNMDDEETDEEKEQRKKDMEKALEKYMDKLYNKEKFWEPLTQMSLKMANRVERSDFRDAIKQWARGEREGLIYMIDDSSEDVLDMIVWVTQGAWESVDTVFIQLIDPKGKLDEDTKNNISDIFSLTKNMFNKQAFRPIMKVMTNMMKDPEKYKNNPDALVSDLADGVPEMMEGMMGGMPGADPKMAAEMKKVFEDPNMKEAMKGNFKHGFQHPMGMDPQFHHKPPTPTPDQQ